MLNNLVFDRPRTAIAVDFPGLVAFNLYSEGELIFASGPASAPIGEVVFFGVLSDQPFDAAFIRDPSLGDSITIDNLFFGDLIPRPRRDGPLRPRRAVGSPAQARMICHGK